MSYEGQFSDVGKRADTEIQKITNHMKDYASQLIEIQELALRIASSDQRFSCMHSPEDLVRKCLNIHVYGAHRQTIDNDESLKRINSMSAYMQDHGPIHVLPKD